MVAQPTWQRAHFVGISSRDVSIALRWPEVLILLELAEGDGRRDGLHVAKHEEARVSTLEVVVELVPRDAEGVREPRPRFVR